MKTRGFISTLIILVAMAAAGVSVPLGHHWGNLRAKGWPDVMGEVVRFDRRFEKGMRGEVCNLRVRYRFAVAGKEYTGRRLWYGGTESCFDPHLPDLQSGQLVSVAYDPRRPRNAVLMRSHPIHRSDFVIAAATIIVAMSILSLGLALDRRQRLAAAVGEPPSA